MRLLIIFMCLFCGELLGFDPVVAQAQTFRLSEMGPAWKGHYWSQGIDPPAAHFFGSALLSSELEEHMSWWKADLLTLAIGAIWEVKDALVPFEKYPIIGAEGADFSGDFVIDIGGVLAHRLKHWLF